jgi:hypothetical protein
MKIELVNHAKYRAPGRQGDDVPLILPGVVFGIFDGATDAHGTVMDGIGMGRVAALTVAQATAALLLDPAARRLPLAKIIAYLSNALSARCAPLSVPIAPSTTVALAIDCGDVWRFITLGDTGIRLNGTEVLFHEKIIDAVSTHARVALFQHFATTMDDPDTIEAATRRGILLGLDNAVAEQHLTAAQMDDIIGKAAKSNGLDHAIDDVRAFLRGGIRVQHKLANGTGNALNFDSMNGTIPGLSEVVDEVRAKEDVHSIEIFTDGFPVRPRDISAAAWEQAFTAAEDSDFHKIGAFATVKGSTSTEYFDDRTVLVLDRLTAAS